MSKPSTLGPRASLRARAAGSDVEPEVVEPIIGWRLLSHRWNSRTFRRIKLYFKTFPQRHAQTRGVADRWAQVLAKFARDLSRDSEVGQRFGKAKRGPTPGRTKLTVVIERHEQTIIRRSAARSAPNRSRKGQ